MKAIQDLKNSLLKRREVKIVVNSVGNPGFANAQKIIADEFKSEDDVIVVKRVMGKFGRDTFLIDALIYDSAAAKDKMEPKVKVKKAAEGAAK